MSQVQAGSRAGGQPAAAEWPRAGDQDDIRTAALLIAIVPFATASGVA